MNRLAKILWEAWETQFRKGNDQPALDWDLIPPEIQACWVAVAAACQQRQTLVDIHINFVTDEVIGIYSDGSQRVLNTEGETLSQIRKRHFPQ